MQFMFTLSRFFLLVVMFLVYLFFPEHIRVKNPLSSFEVQQEGSESVSSMNRPVSPAVSESSSGQKMRMQRAERVKRRLTAKKIKGKTKATFDQDETEHDPEMSTEDIKSPTVLLEQMVIQESEDTEAGNSLDEVRKQASTLLCVTKAKVQPEITFTDFSLHCVWCLKYCFAPEPQNKCS